MESGIFISCQFQALWYAASSSKALALSGGSEAASRMQGSIFPYSTAVKYIQYLFKYY
jgi:hypothetical protein